MGWKFRLDDLTIPNLSTKTRGRIERGLGEELMIALKDLGRIRI